MGEEGRKRKKTKMGMSTQVQVKTERERLLCDDFNDEYVGDGVRRVMKSE